MPNKQQAEAIERNLAKYEKDEKEGAKTYTEAAGKAEKEDKKEFKEMAEDEKEHLKSLKKMGKDEKKEEYEGIINKQGRKKRFQ